MNFREQMGKLRREYRVETSRLDKRIDELSEQTRVNFSHVQGHARGMQEQMGLVHEQMGRVQEQMGRVQEQMGRVQEQMGLVQKQMGRVQEQMGRVQGQMTAMNDQAGGFVESLAQVQADHQETTRTMLGRSRLLEDRFGKMLDLVESTLEEVPTASDFQKLIQRVEALEKKNEPAA